MKYSSIVSTERKNKGEIDMMMGLKGERLNWRSNEFAVSFL